MKSPNIAYEAKDESARVFGFPRVVLRHVRVGRIRHSEKVWWAVMT